MRWVAPTENEAMADIEKHNPQLAGVLPRNYQIFNGTLLKELLKKVSEIPVSLDYDGFGRIYEYFLGQFARIVNSVCGSSGMFVQSARFVAEHKKNPRPSSPSSASKRPTKPGFGLPRTDNANYLWIQLFYSSLNDTWQSRSALFRRCSA